MGGGLGFGWCCGLLGATSFMLPFMTFGVLKSWQKTLEVFGLSACIIRLVIFFVKALIYLVIAAPTPEAIHVTMSSVVMSCMGASFTACIVLCYISHISNHGEEAELVNRSWAVSVLFLVGVGIILRYIKLRVQAGNGILAVMIAPIIGVQLYQAAMPLVNHFWSSDELVEDEAPVLAIKIVSITITIVTSLHSAWSTWIPLKPHVTPFSLQMHLAMCIAGATAGLLQLMMRMINAQNKLKAAFEKICAAFTQTDNAWDLLRFCLDGVIEGMKLCAIAVWSSINSGIVWAKGLFGKRDPVLPLVVAEKPHDV